MDVDVLNALDDAVGGAPVGGVLGPVGNGVHIGEVLQVVTLRLLGTGVAVEDGGQLLAGGGVTGPQGAVSALQHLFLDGPQHGVAGPVVDVGGVGEGVQLVALHLGGAGDAVQGGGHHLAGDGAVGIEGVGGGAAHQAGVHNGVHSARVPGVIAHILEVVAHGAEGGVGHEGELVALVHLVGQGVGEEHHVHAVLAIGNGLDGVVLEGLQAVAGGEEALQQLLGAVHAHQHLGGVGDGGEVARAVAVHDVVALGHVAGGNQALGGIGHVAQRVHGVAAGNLPHQRALVKELGGGADGGPRREPACPHP